MNHRVYTVKEKQHAKYLQVKGYLI